MADAACRVLVIDDHAGICDLLADYLAGAGFEVRAAANGRNGLEVLRTWRPDLILLDLEMPVMDGGAFRAAQFGMREVADVPVVIFSANRDVREQAAVLRAAGVVRKSCDLDELVRAIERARFAPAGAVGPRRTVPSAAVGLPAPEREELESSDGWLMER